MCSDNFTVVMLGHSGFLLLLHGNSDFAQSWAGQGGGRSNSVVWIVLNQMQKVLGIHEGCCICCWFSEPLCVSLVNSVDTEEGGRALVAFINLF